MPFFFFLVIELTVILFEGAAAGRQGSVGPVMKLGFGELPLRFARPIESVAPELTQKTYCELTATPQTSLLGETALGMNALLAVPPPTGARPIPFVLEP